MDIREKFSAFLAWGKEKVSSLTVSASAAVAVAASAAGNYTAINTPTSIETAAPGIMTAFELLLDMLTGMGNWYVTNAMGELYIAMACLMFVFILIKSLFRHSGGRGRR